MRRLALALTLAASVGLGTVACGAKDPELCDLKQSLGALYQDSHGYVPSNIQDDIDKYC